MAVDGFAITSAAIPDFQEKPIAVVHPATNEGTASGTYMVLMVFHLEKLKILAISRRFLSVFFTADEVLAHRTGITRRQDIMTVMPSRFTHTSSRMMKEATGVVLISVNIGENKLYMASDTAVTAPRNVPIMMPRIQPADILRSERRQLFQKSEVAHRLRNLEKTETGEGNRKRLPISTEMICQIRSHTSMAPIFISAFLLSDVVEVVIRYFSSDRSRVRFEQDF